MQGIHLSKSHKRKYNPQLDIIMCLITKTGCSFNFKYTDAIFFSLHSCNFIYNVLWC